MAGLTLVLEGETKPAKGKTQISSKTGIMKITDISSSSTTSSDFLDYCFLCRRRLLPGNDIYMYKGDRGFCSVECRFTQMFMDDTGKPSFNTVTKGSSSSSSSSGSGSTSSRRRRGGGGSLLR